MRAAFRMIIAVFVLMAAACPVGAVERVVSLDYCADQFMLSLADRSQIMALSRDATQSHSFYADQAQGIRQFGATAEEVLHINPDLVIRYWGGRKFLDILARADIPVVSPRYGSGADMLYKNLRLVGKALDREAQAEKLIAAHFTRHENLRQKPALALRAVYITPSGTTAGTGTFVDDILHLAGLKTVAGELGLEGWQAFPLEALVHNPPDIIIGSFFDLDNPRIANWSIARHGRIKEMMDNIPTILVPGRYLSCNGIFTLEAAEYIRDHIEGMRKE